MPPYPNPDTFRCEATTCPRANTYEICGIPRNLPRHPQALLLPHPLPRIAALPPIAVLSQPHILRSDLQRKSLSFAPKILSPRSLAPQKSTKLRAPIFLASPLSSGKLHWPQPLGLPLIISPSKKNCSRCRPPSSARTPNPRNGNDLEGGQCQYNINSPPPPGLRPRVDRRPFRSAPFKQSNAPQCLRRVRAQQWRRN